MNDLQKMQASCKEFESDLKTGNVEWKVFEWKTIMGFTATMQGISFDIWIETIRQKFVFSKNNGYPIELTSTTAKEAAHEALQLVKNEAQKLVEALSEPKEGNTVEKFMQKVKQDLESEPKEEMPKTKELYNKAEKHFWESMQEHKKLMAEKELEIEDLLDKLNKEYSTYQKP